MSLDLIGGLLIGLGLGALLAGPYWVRIGEERAARKWSGRRIP
jgi:hypothetical protein